MVNGDKLWPVLVPGLGHVVSYHNLRRAHGAEAAAQAWARAVAEGATLPNGLIRWGWYSSWYDKAVAINS